MPQNIVGPQVRKLRYERGWTQEEFAAKLQRLDWDISRQTLSKIEARLRCVSDEELPLLARALQVSIDKLYPAKTLR
ncbi:MAG: helix-turn-helix transcriptional regulator [Verrucomicrobia bacterium]|nr:helix-turn-helix transcriptional regulator [Verrucomicrobiota bacterium]